jgi:hypothetical protein
MSIDCPPTILLIGTPPFDYASPFDCAPPFDYTSASPTLRSG